MNNCLDVFYVQLLRNAYNTGYYSLGSFRIVDTPKLLDKSII